MMDRVEELENALANLLRAVDTMQHHASYRDVFRTAYEHGVMYTGPSYSSEWVEARRLLAANGFEERINNV